MKKLLLKLIPAPAERVGWRRNLVWVLLVAPLVAVVVWTRLLPFLLGESGANSNAAFPSPEFPAFFTIVGSVLMASLASWIWNRRARAIQKGLAGAGWWMALRPLVFGVGSVVTAIGLFYAVENWRGARAWAPVEAEMRAKGLGIDLASIISPPIPDERNFAATPLFKAGYTLVPRTTGRRGAFDSSFIMDMSPAAEAARKRIQALTTFEPEPDRTKVNSGMGGPAVGRLPNGRVDLAQYMMGLRKAKNYQFNASPGSPAADLLAAFSQREADFAEFAAAARRPECRFDVHPEELAATLLPYLAPVKGLSHTFFVRSVARLMTKDRAGAFEDMMTSTRLGETPRTEGYVISQLVRIAVHAFGLRAFAEGLAEHAWSDAQLREYQQFQAGLDFRDVILHGLQTEQTMIQLELEELKHHRSVSEFDRLFSSDSSNDTSDDLYPLAFRFGPAGWFDQNRVLMARNFLWAVDRMKSSRLGFLSGPAMDEHLLQMKAESSQHFAAYSYYFIRLAPALKGFCSRSGGAEVRRQLAVTACALERYWLQHREYPTALSALVPEFLAEVPVDPLHPGASKDSSAPLTYRRTDDGWFTLYSFGENQRDDGGVFREKGSAVELDWVWPVPVGEGRRMF